jgi:hypothetical protein
VACQGQNAELLSASPNNGYQMRVDNEGPSQVRVEFIGAAAQSEISATCVSGRPWVAVYNDE